MIIARVICDYCKNTKELEKLYTTQYYYHDPKGWIKNNNDQNFCSEKCKACYTLNIPLDENYVTPPIPIKYNPVIKFIRNIIGDYDD